MPLRPSGADSDCNQNHRGEGGRCWEVRQRASVGLADLPLGSVLLLRPFIAIYSQAERRQARGLWSEGQSWWSAQEAWPQSPTCIPTGGPSAESCVTCDAPDDCRGPRKTRQGGGEGSRSVEGEPPEGIPAAQAQLALFASCSGPLLAGV